MNNNNLIESFYSWYRGAIRHPKWRWAIILGTAFYLISPIDISPDLIPIVGWLDDGILATLLVTELSSLMMDYLKKGNSSEGTTTVADADDVIDVEAEVG
ncbi:MAG: YkvA family protein [Cyanobacteria bacterium J06649_4]